MSIDSEMERVARVVAADQALEVHVRGIKAYATPGHVTIPNLEHFGWLGSMRDARRMLHGLLDHECGHASDTDFVALKRWNEQKPCEALHTLWNMIEDGYVERLQGRRYRGCAQNIERMNEWFYAEPDEEGCTPLAHCARAADFAAVVFAIGTILTPHGRPLEFYQRNAALYERLLGIKLELDALLAVTTSKQTQQHIDAAVRIFGLLGEQERERARSGAGGDNPSSEGDLSRWTRARPMRASELVELIVQDAFEQPSSTQPYAVFGHEFDIERDFGAEDCAGLVRQYEREALECRFVADDLVLCFETALRAAAEVRYVGGHDEGDIDPGAIAEFSTGTILADQIYQRRTVEDGNAVAVEILIDCSGSMRGQKAELARRAALAMSMALSQVQIAHEITGFTTLLSSQGMAGPHEWSSGRERDHARVFEGMRAALSEAALRGTDVLRFAREVYGVQKWGPSAMLQTPIHAVFKSFDQPQAYGLMHCEGLMENLDGEAVLWAAKRLARRPEHRRVLFVLSDGLPAGSRDNLQGARYLKDVVERVIVAGIDVYGLGIQSAAVRAFYPTYWLCRSLSDLTALAMGSLTLVLTDSRVEAQAVAL